MERDDSWHPLRASTSALLIWKRSSKGFRTIAANAAARQWADADEILGLPPSAFDQFDDLATHLAETLDADRGQGLLTPLVRLEPIQPDLVVMTIEPSVTDTARYEAMGRVSAAMAHDFNNLLTVINSYTEMMLDAVADDDPQHRLLQEVFEAGEKAAGLTAKFLATTGEAPTSPPARQQPRADLSGSETILLAEDERALRGLLERALIGAGYTVVTAADGADALSLIGEIRPDLLVTDVVMPKIGGKELAETLAARQAEIKVLYISGYGARDVANHGLGAELHLLQKPFSSRELLLEVRRILDGSLEPE